MARIPPKSVSSDDKKVLEHLERDLKRLVFGQDKAIEVLSSAMKLSRAGSPFHAGSLWRLSFPGGVLGASPGALGLSLCFNFRTTRASPACQGQSNLPWPVQLARASETCQGQSCWGPDQLQPARANPGPVQLARARCLWTARRIAADIMSSGQPSCCKRMT